MSALGLLLGLAALTDLSESGSWGSSSWGCYGNIPTLETPGASCGVGRPRGLNCSGVRASERLAEIDMAQLVRYQPITRTVGRKYCVDPAVITAVLSRQAHRGNVLVNVGDVGDGVGVVQLDKKIHDPVGAWDSKEHLFQGVGILTDRIKAIQKKFPTWNVAQHVKGGLSAFKSGIKTIVTPVDIDTDFVNDLLARAKLCKRHGF